MYGIVTLKRCGIETRQVVANGKVTSAHYSSAGTLQNALAKALMWNQTLLTGPASSITDLAKREKVTWRHIRCRYG
jgi:hypothetical protein